MHLNEGEDAMDSMVVAAVNGQGLIVRLAGVKGGQRRDTSIVHKIVSLYVHQ